MSAARRPQLSPADRKRAERLDDIRDAINDLIRQVRTAATLTRDKGKGADGIIRAAPTNQLHRTKEPGLLLQLQWAAGHRHAVVKPQLGYGRGLGYGVDASWLLESETTTSVRYDQGGHSKPTSRPPTDLAAVDLLADVTAGARAWRQRLGGKGRRPLVGELRALTGLAHTGTNTQVRALLRDAQSWVRSSRLALAYDAAIVDLPAMVCPECGGALRVLADASSDVWCAGGPWERCIIATRQVRAWTPGCGAVWPQGQWLLLLEAMEDGPVTITEFLEARLAEDEALPNMGDCTCQGYPCTAHPDCDERQLREVAAKRAILEIEDDPGADDPTGERGLAMALVLEALASVYADHPDYQQAWAPEPQDETVGE